MTNKHLSNEVWAAQSVESSKKDHEKARGVHIDVSNLSYSVKLDKSIKNLLNKVSFTLDPGTMCALMGPSGAGKSTLLDLLANRKLNGNWSGEMEFNHTSRNQWFNRDSAYVLQDDVHIATLTVEETIYYSAWVRLPEGSSHDQLKTRVTLLMEMMGLSHIKDSRVGDAMHRGISGGQLKRLSIAVEIVAMPNLIFLDEPTSGLDSSIALEVMTVVRSLADQNRTCISTIHQPSPEVFHLFDKVILLSEGCLIYAGPTDHVTAYFMGLGYTFPEFRNPAEFIIDVSDGKIKNDKSDKLATATELESLWRQSPLNYSEYQKHNSDNTILHHKKLGQVDIILSQAKYDRLHATTKRTQFKMLMHRSW